jgi:hypothetical protein
MNTLDHHTENFFLSEGGPSHQIMLKAGMHEKQKTTAIAAFCITWVPLFIITSIEGTLYTGTQLPFIKDVAMQARLLIALQMLILIKNNIDKRVSSVLMYFTETLVGEEDRKIVVPAILSKARKLTDSVIAEILILILVIIATTIFLHAGFYNSLEDEASSWMTTVAKDNITLSIAGYWAVLVSIPVFQFLLGRWLWRYFVWVLLLFRLSRTNLNLLPTHADRAGGLGVIMSAQRSFNKLFIIGSVVLSGQFILRLSRHPDQFIMIRNEAVGYVIIAIVFVLVPFLFFSSILQRTKLAGLQKLSALGFVLSRRFEKEWTPDLSIEKRFEENKTDPSMLFDYAGLYDQIKKIRAIPVTLGDITGLAIPLLAPFIPILFIRFSVGELLQRIVGMLV